MYVSVYLNYDEYYRDVWTNELIRTRIHACQVKVNCIRIYMRWCVCVCIYSCMVAVVTQSGEERDRTREIEGIKKGTHIKSSEK